MSHDIHWCITEQELDVSTQAMILKKASEAAVEENQTELAAELDRQRSAVLSKANQGKTREYMYTLTDMHGFIEVWFRLEFWHWLWEL